MTAPYGQRISLLNRNWIGAALAITVIAATPLFTAPPVAAQSSDVQPLVNTINRLERQLQALERTVYRGGPRPAGASGTSAGSTGGAPPAAVSQLQLKTNQLEEQMRGLTGQIEEIGFKVNQISARLDRLVADVDFRLRALESTEGQTNAVTGTPAPDLRTQVAPPGPTGATPGANNVASRQGGGATTAGSLGTISESQLEAARARRKTPGATTTDAAPQQAPQQATASPSGTVALPEGSPEDRYNYARSFLMRRDFPGAEQALRAFVETYPDNELTGAAQYWLGETYYVRNDFGTAARTFADGFQRYPDSNKAPDNLLKLGMSLAALERTEDACITFEKLASEYPKSSASIKQRAQSERTRLRCK
ncbi:MAG: tol-pal system protein YbgF [Alphaproteobacteria bacterium]|nr:tol-pal system protein YbgF [Alphaproteobacteria bacterium]